MRADDRKRVSKAQQRARKERIQEERIRQKYEQETPLVPTDKPSEVIDPAE